MGRILNASHSAVKNNSRDMELIWTKMSENYPSEVKQAFWRCWCLPALWLKFCGTLQTNIEILCNSNQTFISLRPNISLINILQKILLFSKHNRKMFSSLKCFHHRLTAKGNKKQTKQSFTTAGLLASCYIKLKSIWGRHTALSPAIHLRSSALPPWQHH